jgi:predicted nucleotidyltransferase
MLQQRFSDSVRIISIDRDELLARLREIAAQIRMERPEVEEVRVFGSIARGDQIGTSDVDVLIVVRDGEMGDSMEQVRSLYPYFDLPIGVDLLVFSQEQLARRLQTGDPFLTQVWRESRRL